MTRKPGSSKIGFRELAPSMTRRAPPATLLSCRAIIEIKRAFRVEDLGTMRMRCSWVPVAKSLNAGLVLERTLCRALLPRENGKKHAVI